MAEPVRPASAFVTGAAGFIGAAVAKRLRAAGTEVRGVDRADGPEDGIMRGDITEPGAWQAHAAGCELVVHTAAVVGMYSSPSGYWETNVRATRLALDAAVAGGAKRFLHLSSIVVHGFEFEGEVDEASPVRPNGVHYVDTKIASEQVVLAAHAAGEIPCTIVRPGDVYGPRSRPWTTEPVRLLKEKSLVLPAGGRGIHSPVYVDDLVEGIELAATIPEAAGHIFILTGPEHVAIGEFFGHYSRMLGIDPPRTAPAALARSAARAIDAAARLRGRRSEVTAAAVDYLMRRGTYSIARAGEALGYQPGHELDAGMARTEEWLRAEKLV
jgi:nucleoside-diphosphate-sugar epimerase